MERLIILAFIGFLAQLVDGSLGMAYGLTSTSLLLLYGSAPAVASASVHLAEVVTTATSGISHWKLGNIDRGIVWRLVIPGALGAFVGACFLSSLPGEKIKPFISGFLFLLGAYILVRFSFFRVGSNSNPTGNSAKKRWTDAPLGLMAGFLDAIGGGGWGPLATPVLLAQKDIEPRKVIGSVDASECAVAFAASAGFLISMGWKQVDWTWVWILMAGGVIAAPFAAWIVRKISANILGVTVGCMILFTNGSTILQTFKTPDMGKWIFYGMIILLWLFVLLNIKRKR